jgi:hypothetical protein
MSDYAGSDGGFGGDADGLVMGEYEEGEGIEYEEEEEDADAAGGLDADGNGAAGSAGLAGVEDVVMINAPAEYEVCRACLRSTLDLVLTLLYHLHNTEWR